MEWHELVAIAAAMLAGWAGKQIGQRSDFGGELPMQKATAPGAALFAAGFAVTLCAKVRGVVLDDAQIAAQAGEAWFYAIGAWSLGKNLVQLVREVIIKKRGTE